MGSKTLFRSKRLKDLFNYKMRLFMMVMVFTWLVSFVMFGIFYYREQEYKAEGLNARLQIYNAQMHSALENGIESSKKYAEYVTGSSNVRFTVMDTSGIVIYSTYGIPEGSDNSHRLEVKKAKATGFGYTLRRNSSLDSVPCFYSAMCEGKYVVRTSVPYDFTLMESLQSETVYLWTMFIITIVLSVLAYFASRQFGQNVAKLRDIAEMAVKGELDADIEPDFPNDELWDISRDIIKIYKKGRLANEESDCYYQNLIAEEQEKTRLKNELTTNINHELKTPVHTIRACLETVVENDDIDPKTAKELVVKSYEQVSRLCSLLNDVSLITRISEAPMQIGKKEIDIVPIIKNIASGVDLLPLFQRMRVNMSLPAEMKIYGNESLMESIFNNLFNNSIAYSGGRDIFVKMIEDDDENYVLSYSDNGVGINEKHFPNLFDRFYRVDEGRSRKMGGTGLGLAIVRNAVLFHGGDITVRSREGGGLEFVIKLKKNK